MSRGYFGIAIYRPKTANNVGSLWRTADLYGAAFLGTVGRRYTHQSTDTMHTPKHTPLHHYSDFEDLVAHLPQGCPLVGVELDPRATSLPEFTHPERGLYLLGAEDNGLPPAVVDRCHFLVSVPTVRPQSMNVACAGSVVAAHRHMQLDLARAVQS
jgi:tRNA G18 (ribose-2'-O)-methylase SpoU